MKNILFILLFFGLVTQAQDKYLTKIGSVNFEASVPSFEEVAAKNNSVTAIINTATNEFAALVLVKGFRFKNALMEEHFNENYAESNVYPKATFKGIVIGNKLKDNISGNYNIDGDLTFHGITKPIKDIPVKITFNNDTITLEGTFSINASDFEIKIPNIVKNKVSETVNVNFTFNLVQS